MFIGRHALIWTVASSLHRRENVATTAKLDPETVLLVGCHGIGKTLVAVEYAHRFSRAYPGGIFWLDGRDEWDSVIRSITGAIATTSLDDLANPDGKPIDRLRKALERRGPYLWVMDGMPSGTSMEDVQSRLAPTPNGKSLITTTTRKWEELGRTLIVDSLDSESALMLLTRRDPSQAATAEVHKVLELVGGHPLAIEMLAALVQEAQVDDRWGHWLSKLQRDEAESLDLIEEFELDFVTTTSKSLSNLFRETIGGLPARARKLLSLVIAAKFPLPTFACAELLDTNGDPDLLTIAARRLKMASLIVDQAGFIVSSAVVQRAGRKILGEVEIEVSAGILITKSLAILCDTSITPNVLKQWDRVIFALTDGIQNNDRVRLARAWIDSQMSLSESDAAMWTRMGGRWLQRSIPPVSETEDPWALSWSLRRQHSRAFDQLAIEPMLDRLIASAGVLTSDDASWADRLGSTLLDLDQDRLAVSASFLALAAFKHRGVELHLSSFLTNQRASHRLGDHRGSETTLLMVIAAQVWGMEDARTVQVIEDAACASYTIGDTETAGKLVIGAVDLSTRIMGPRSLASLQARYVFALVLRQIGNLKSALAVLDALLIDWTQHSSVAYLGRIWTLRLMADLSRQLGLRSNAKDLTCKLLAEIRGSYGHLGDLVASHYCEEQSAALRKQGYNDDADDTLLCIDGK